MTDRTLSMMSFEGWLPPHFQPHSIEYLRGLANSTPSYPPEWFRPMSEDELSRFQWSTYDLQHCGGLFESLIGGALGGR